MFCLVCLQRHYKLYSIGVHSQSTHYRNRNDNTYTHTHTNIMGLMTSKETNEETTTVNGGSTTPLEEVMSLLTPSPSSGLGHWKHQQQNHHVRQASVRNRAAQPMPEHSELDMRFAKVLVSIYFFKQINLKLTATTTKHISLCRLPISVT